MRVAWALAGTLVRADKGSGFRGLGVQGLGVLVLGL